LNEEICRKLISGQSRGSCPAIARGVLKIISSGYAAVIGLRNFLYSKGILKIHRVNAAVISVGNITTGGTGKTPLVIWLCNYIGQNYKCAILTRGYKTRQKAKGKRQNYEDEPAVLAQNCPQAKVIVNPDRAAGAMQAVNAYGANVLIMDDGFQHRRLARDIDIVVVDAMEPFGYGKMLPAGLLREPVDSLKRANAIVITRCNQAAKSKLARLEEELQMVNPHITIARSIHKAVFAQYFDGRKTAVEELEGKKIFAFCGIGNPQGFLDTIKELKADVIGSIIYDDHHCYTEEDVAEISGQAERSKADLILTTEKDRTKIDAMISGDEGGVFAYLAIKLEFISGEKELRRLIDEALACKIQKS
jgi:tetraacyldisaccharide 4'-kinase